MPGYEDAEESDGVVETKLVPVAAEFTDGTVCALYEDIMEHINEVVIEESSEPDNDASEITPVRKYPERRDFEKSEDLAEARNEYWGQFGQYFEPKHAMEVLENAASEHGRVDWIAYRLPLSDGEQTKTLHLYIEPEGEYPTGTFAYNLIKRGHKHGLRLVGTMKSEPDLNVLAVYER